MENIEQLLREKFDAFDSYYAWLYNTLVLIANQKVTEWYNQFLWFKSAVTLRSVSEETVDLIHRKYVEMYNERQKFTQIQIMEIPDELAEKFEARYTDFKQKARKANIMQEAFIKMDRRAETHYVNDSLFDGFFCGYAEETVDIARKTLKIIKNFI